MASYNDIPLPARVWTAIPAAPEDTIVSPAGGDVRLSSNPGGTGSSGIKLVRDTAHLIRANTELWTRPAGGVEGVLVRMSA